MNRRHFAFWFSFGLFALAERLQVYGLDELAAAMMRDEKSPPTRRSTVADVVCQSSDAAFHCTMSSGFVYRRQTVASGAATVVSTVIFIGPPWSVSS